MGHLHVRRQTKAQLENHFYRHAVVFGLVNTGLAVFNLLTSPDELWFIYTLFGWGIGLAWHGCKVILAAMEVR